MLQEPYAKPSDDFAHDEFAVTTSILQPFPECHQLEQQQFGGTRGGGGGRRRRAPPQPHPRGSQPPEASDGTEPPPVPPRVPGAYAAHLVPSASSTSASSQQDSSSPAPSSPPDPQCSMTLLERMIRTSSTWFLPDIGRSGAVHYLQGKDIGNFIVRQSSKKDVLALSVRLPVDCGPYIEHYLIESMGEGRHRLEGSENVFPSLPMLVTHYCQCCDELPVQLKLPDILMSATTRQELSSLSLLGQELWISSMLRSRTHSTSTMNSSTSSSFHSAAKDHNANIEPQCTFVPSSPTATSTVPNSEELPPPVPAVRPTVLQLPVTIAVKPVPLPRAVHPPPTPPQRCLSQPTEKQSPTADSSVEPSQSPNSSGGSESSPEAYYCSSLADKISDYEDIWGMSGESPSKMSTFKPLEEKRKVTQKIEGKEHVSRDRGNRQSAEVPHTFICQATQTESPEAELVGMSNQGAIIGGLSRSMPGMSGDGFVQERHPKPDGQFASPFYAEPVDSIFVQQATDEQKRVAGRMANQRHSEPNVHSLATGAVDVMSVLEETVSSTTDHVMGASTPALNHKVVETDQTNHRVERSWSVDASWTWVGSDDDEDDDSGLEPRFPVDSEMGAGSEDVTTVEDLIALSYPDLQVPHIHPLTERNVLRASRYDNLDADSDMASRASETLARGNEDDDATEFCEPWDSLRWERLLRLVEPIAKTKQQCEDMVDVQQTKMDNSRMSCGSVDSASAISGDTSEAPAISEYPTMTLPQEQSRCFQERLKVLLASKRVAALRNKDSTVGVNIRKYIFKLVEERNTTFAMTIENFIQCTQESSETSPAVVMRNIRQFMSGMKNYLLKHGEGQFEQLVQEEQTRLKPHEFMNIDAVIEEALHRLVIRPLKQYLYQLFVNHFTKTGSLKLLSDNIKYARTKTPEDLGIGKDYQPPQGISLEVVKYFLSRLQQSYSPLKKLENLLAAISTIYNSVQKDTQSRESDSLSLGADDFLPIFIYVLVQCGLISAEIEAEYMWGLLHPSLLTGEGGYYLTTLSSAVHILKNLHSPTIASPPPSAPKALASSKLLACGGDCKWYKSADPIRYPTIADLQGFMQIVIPNEVSGSVVAKTLPVRPNMTTKEVCKMIAHKFQVTNPQDYSLFKLVNGEETQLGDNECPQTIKADLITSGTDCRFAYKRCDMKFVWPCSDKQQ
ncbi:protein sprint-like isoform X2 [Ornithodoros turicata]